MNIAFTNRRLSRGIYGCFSDITFTLTTCKNHDKKQYMFVCIFTYHDIKSVVQTHLLQLRLRLFKFKFNQFFMATQFFCYHEWTGFYLSYYSTKNELLSDYYSFICFLDLFFEVNMNNNILNALRIFQTDGWFAFRLFVLNMPYTYTYIDRLYIHVYMYIVLSRRYTHASTPY